MVLKVAKPLRSQEPLADGVWVEITGERKLKDLKLSFKMHTLARLANEAVGSLEYGHMPEPSTSSRMQIEVCRKRNCCKRGGDRLWAYLQSCPGVDAIATGCLKACKQGPAIAVNGHCYGKVEIDDLVHLVAEQTHSAAQVPMNYKT